MTAKAMTPSQQQRFIRICEDQGIRVTRTKKGLFIRFPDGTSTVQHFTTSDVKAVPNQISRFRRAGMTHPDDPRGPKDLPKYITGGTISEATRKKIVDYVVSRGIPDIVYQKDVTKDLNMDPGWANRALYHTGFRPGKAKNSKIGRPWYTPQELVDQRTPEPSDVDVPVEPKPTLVHDPVVGEEPKPDPRFEPETIAAVGKVTDAGWDVKTMIIGPTDPVLEEALAQIEDDDEQDLTDPETPTPEQVGQAVEDGTAEDVPIPHVDFIDERDSWVVDPEELLGVHLHRMMQDRLAVLRAVGLDFEIRVWRKGS
jgi:hypothetical protein